MAFIYKRLTEITTLGATAVLFNNSTASTTSYVRSIILHNTHTSGVIVKLYNVPNSGGAPGAATTSNQFFYDASMDAGQTIMIEFPIPGLVLSDQYDSIQGYADNAGKVTIQIFGGQETA